MANRLAHSGITLPYALSVDQDVRCSCCDSGLLPSISGDRRLCNFVAQRFRAKSIAYTDTDRFSDPGIQPYAQPDADSDSKGSDADQSQSDADSNSNTDGNSDPNAPGLSGYECHTDAHASACNSLTVF
jgi:hypothetical protein